MPSISLTVTGVVLCGGRGTRMGGVDKGLQPFRGRAMVEWVLERFEPQVADVFINANQNLERYLAFGHPVLRDRIEGFAGPLAGLHAALAQARSELVVTVPCDSPFLPPDLVHRLVLALEQAEAAVAVAKTGGQPHPVFSLCRVSVLEHLSAFLHDGGRKVNAWHASLKTVEVDFADQAESFRNINTLEELRDFDSGDAR